MNITNTIKELKVGTFYSHEFEQTTNVTLHEIRVKMLKIYLSVDVETIAYKELRLLSRIVKHLRLADTLTDKLFDIMKKRETEMIQC